MTENSVQEPRDLSQEQGGDMEDLGPRDEVPTDVSAFYGHPLANGEDTNASARALLHEYQNLPAIDCSNQKVGDKFDGLSEMLRQEEEKKETSSNDYAMLLTSDVDAFLNRNGKVDGSQAKTLGTTSPKIDSRKPATPSTTLPSPLLGANQVKLSDHNSPSPSKCFQTYEHYSSPESDTSGTADVHTSLTAPLKIVEDINMVDSGSNLSVQDSVVDHQGEKLNPQSKSKQQANANSNTKTADTDNIVLRKSTKEDHISVDCPQKGEMKQKEVKPVTSEPKARSILAAALTGGHYKPAAEGSTSTESTAGHLLTSKPDVIPPPPPYHTPTHSVASLQPGLSLPPVSAICQQIEKDHPQMAEMPLAIIKKSLFALGFPENGASGTCTDGRMAKQPNISEKTADKSIVHSLLLHHKHNRLELKGTPHQASQMSSSHDTTSFKPTNESVHRLQPGKKPKKRKKQSQIESESVNANSSHFQPKASVSSSTLHMQNNDIPSFTAHRTVVQPSVKPISVTKPLDSMYKLPSSLSPASSIFQSVALVRRHSIDTVPAASSSSHTCQHNIRPTVSLSKTPDAISHLETSFPVKKPKIHKAAAEHMLDMSRSGISHSTSNGYSDTNTSQSDKFTKMVQLPKSTVSLSDRKSDNLQTSFSYVDRPYNSSPLSVQNNSSNKSAHLTPTSSDDIPATSELKQSSVNMPVNSEPKTNPPESAAFVSNTSSICQSPLQYLPAPYPSLPTDESQLLCHLLGGTVLRPHGSGPASHVIVPKSVFNMATQRFCFPFNGVNVPQISQAPHTPPNSQVSLLPSAAESPKHNFTHSKSVEENTRQSSIHSESLDEHSKQHYMHSKSLEENTRQSSIHSESLDEHSKQHYMHSKSGEQRTNYMHTNPIEQNQLQHPVPYNIGQASGKLVDNIEPHHLVHSKPSPVSSAAENLSINRKTQYVRPAQDSTAKQHMGSDTGFISQQKNPASLNVSDYSKRPSFLPVATRTENVSVSSHIYSTSTTHSPDTVNTQYSDVSDGSSGRQSAPLFEQGSHLNNADNINRTISSPLGYSFSMSAPTTPVYYAGHNTAQNHPLLPVDHKQVPPQSALDQLHVYANQMSAVTVPYKATLNSKHDLMHRATTIHQTPSVTEKDIVVPRIQGIASNTAVKPSIVSPHLVETHREYDTRYLAQDVASSSPSSSSVCRSSDHVPVSSSSSTRTAHGNNIQSSSNKASAKHRHVAAYPADHQMMRVTAACPGTKQPLITPGVHTETASSKKLTSTWIDKTHREHIQPEYSQPLVHQHAKNNHVHKANQSIVHTDFPQQEILEIPKHPDVPPTVRHNWEENQCTRLNEPMQSSTYFKEEDKAKHGDSKKHLYQDPYDLSISKAEVRVVNTKSTPVESNNNQFGNNNPVLVIKSQSAPTTSPNAIHPATAGGGGGYPNELKSPDSGFHESCVSPSDAAVGHHNYSDYLHERRSATSTSDVVGVDNKQQMRRRRSACSSRQPQLYTCPEKSISNTFSIPKLDPLQCHYRCYLETPISASQKVNEDKMTYLNKGQYYNLVIEYKRKTRPLPSKTVKSRVMVVFREEKCVQDEYRAWEFWHSRQHSPKQRVIELDAKSSSGIIPGSTEDTSHNCVSFRWNPLDENAKVSVSINCLSTDFSNQKGVKGLPLHVEVDTLENDHSTTPVHRSYCQIKVFCDKGAERKARDEERKKETKPKDSGKGGSKKKAELKVHPHCDISEFYHRADFLTPPVLYSPAIDTEPAPVKIRQVPYVIPTPKTLLSPLYITSGDEPDVVPCKRPRKLSRESTSQQEKVLLYVREKTDEAFTALMLLTPTMSGLAQAVEEKYNIPATKIRNVYKRSQKGILVKVDDNIIRHYSNEATFLITIQHTEPTAEPGGYDITLSEVDIT